MNYRQRWRHSNSYKKMFEQTITIVCDKDIEAPDLAETLSALQHTDVVQAVVIGECLYVECGPSSVHSHEHAPQDEIIRINE